MIISILSIDLEVKIQDKLLFRDGEMYLKNLRTDQDFEGFEFIRICY